MTGRDGITAHALPHDRLLETMARFGRPAGPATGGLGGRWGERARSIREATEDDLPAIREILAAHGNDGAIVIADVVGPYLRHLIAHGRARVAADDGAVVGFGAAIDTGRSVHLADLFVQSGPARPGDRPAAARGGLRRRRAADDLRLRRPARPADLRPGRDAAAVGEPLRRGPVDAGCRRRRPA